MNAKLTDTQLKKLKTADKNKVGTTVRMILKMFNGKDLPRELLLTIRQKTKLRNALNNNMSTDIKLSKTKISKIIQSGGFLGSLLSKLAGPLMKVAAPLAKTVLAPLGITAAPSTIDAGIQKKMHGSGTTTSIISNKEMNGIMKNVQALILIFSWKESLKQFNKKNKTKEQKGKFWMMLLGTLRASLLGNLLSGKGIVRPGSRNKTGKGIVRTGYGNKKEWDF